MVESKLAPSQLTLALIRQLIAFDTVSSNDNLLLVRWIEEYLQAFGIKSRLTFNPDKTKANLFASVGGKLNGGIVLAGHTDTATIAGQAWTKPPFAAVIENDRLYGRGAAAMKSFIGVCLALIPEMLDVQGKRSIHLAFTFDAETTMLGARTLIADLQSQGIRPMACLVGAPTELKPIVGHKGRRTVRCHVRGRSAHSSVPERGVNAIEYASRIVSHLQIMAERHRQYEKPHYGYEVPYSTMLTTQIEGGHASDAVPAECTFGLEFRHLPGTDAVQLEAELRKFAATKIGAEMGRGGRDCSIEFSTLSNLPAFGAATASEALPPGLTQLLTLMGRRHSPLNYSGFVTEASWYHRAGIPTVICGPGEVEQSNQPDEHIHLSQIAESERLLRDLVQANR